jgi:hypothetical protein
LHFNGLLGVVEATIEAPHPNFPCQYYRSSRVTIWASHIVGDAVLSTTLEKGQGCSKHRNRGNVIEIGSKGAQFRAAEKGGEGMAFKIFTGAKPILKASFVTEIMRFTL